MTLYYADGQLRSVAKDDCPKCHGTGIALGELRSGDVNNHRGASTFTVTVRWCDCIGITREASLGEVG